MTGCDPQARGRRLDQMPPYAAYGNPSDLTPAFTSGQASGAEKP